MLANDPVRQKTTACRYRADDALERPASFLSIRALHRTRSSSLCRRHAPPLRLRSSRQVQVEATDTSRAGSDSNLLVAEASALPRHRLQSTSELRFVLSCSDSIAEWRVLHYHIKSRSRVALFKASRCYQLL